MRKYAQVKIVYSETFSIKIQIPSKLILSDFASLTTTTVYCIHNKLNCMRIVNIRSVV